MLPAGPDDVRAMMTAPSVRGRKAGGMVCVLASL